MVQFSAHVMSRPSGKHGILHNDQRENGCEYFRVVFISQPSQIRGLSRGVSRFCKKSSNGSSASKTDRRTDRQTEKRSQ